MDKKIFFDALRASHLLGPTIEPSEVQGTEALLDACSAAGFGPGWTAYVLATAWLETNATMQPVKEAYWLSESARQAYLFRMYDKGGRRPAKARQLGNTEPGDGVRYGGWGYTQNTGRGNAIKLTALTGVDYVNHPELYGDIKTSAVASVVAMQNGLYTGKSLSMFLGKQAVGTYEIFVAMRTIVNGMDRAGNIAKAALSFQTFLLSGKW